MSTRFVCQKSSFFTIMLLLVTGIVGVNAQSRQVKNAQAEQSDAQSIKGKTKTGVDRHLSVLGTGGADGIALCPEYIPIQTVETDDTSVQQRDIFYYTVTLTKVPTTAHQIHVILRPILPGGGLGDGYTWPEQIPAGQRMFTFSASATLPPWPIPKDLPHSTPLPVGSYLLEVYQKDDPHSVPHKTLVLHIIPQGGGGAPIYTPVTLVTVEGDAGPPQPSAPTTKAIKQGNLFNFTLTLSEVLVRDKSAHVYVTMTIENLPVGGSPGTVLNTWQEEMPPKQKGHTFTRRAEDSGHNALPPGRYVLRAVRVDGNTPPPPTTTFDIK